MDVLIVEPLHPEVLHWLEARHEVAYAPFLAQDPPDFRQSLAMARATIIPPSVALDALALQMAPRLRIVGRLSGGPENIDLEACARAGIEVVRPASASAAAEAEFAIGALLQMLRRIPIVNDEGLLVGRELGSAVVGIVGLTATARPLALLLTAFGAKVQGYDPALHPSDPLWASQGLTPVGLRELMQTSDAVCVLLHYFQRYAGLFGERLLSEARPNQVIVSLAHSALFDERALAAALTDGPLAAAWLDSLEPGLQDPGRPLRHIDTLQVTPRVAATTQASRIRSAWAVARRVDELLSSAAPLAGFRSTLPDEFAAPADDPGTA